MLYKRSLLVIILLLVFSFVVGAIIKPHEVLADFTGFQLPSAITCPSSFNSPTPTGCTIPISSISWTSATSEQIDTSQYLFNIPTNDIIDDVKYKFTINANSSGWSFFPQYKYPGGSGYISPQTCLNPACFYNTISGTDTNVVITGPNTSTTHTLTPTDINNTGMIFSWWQSGGTKNITISNFQVGIDYHFQAPQISVTSATASPSAGLVTMNVTGDTHYTGSPNTCTVLLYLQSNQTTTQLSNGYVATIKLDSSYTGATKKLADQVWQGFGYSTSVSTWEADGVTVPYYPNASVYVSGTTQCIDSNGNQVSNYQGINSNFPNFDASLNATPSAMQNAPSVIQADCGANVLCSFQNWLQTTLGRIFLPNTFYDQQQFSYVQSTLNSHAPFAYINAITGLDFSATNTATATPTLNLPGFTALATMSGTAYHPPVYHGTQSLSLGDSTGGLLQLGNYTKPVFTIALWLILIIAVVRISILMLH